MTAPAILSTPPPLWRRALAELLGAGLLVAVVVGSGIAAQRLSADPGLQLLENAVATAFGLAVLIVLFAPVSGAHLNPVVSVAVFALDSRDRFRSGAGAVGVYAVAQITGAIGGALLANAMFAAPFGLSGAERAAPGTLLAEVVATAGLVLLIGGTSRTGQPLAVVAASVGAYIGAAYWFTSSTSFANPAVTVGRIFTDTFAGISPASAVAFIGAQAVGGLVGAGLAAALFPRPAAGGATA